MKYLPSENYCTKTLNMDYNTAITSSESLNNNHEKSRDAHIVDDVISDMECDVMSFMTDSIQDINRSFHQHAPLNGEDVEQDNSNTPLQNEGDVSVRRCGRRSAKHRRCCCYLSKCEEKALISGLALGFILGMTYVCWILIGGHMRTQHWNLLQQNSSYVYDDLNDLNTTVAPNDSDVSDEVTIVLPLKVRSPLFIGLLTMEGYIHTRAAACNATWAQPSYLFEVEIFAPKMTSSVHGIIDLGDVGSDDYFHVKKTSAMIQQICERHVDDFDWFMLSTDDVYIRTNLLLSFISEENPDKEVVFGHVTRPIQDAAYRLLAGSNYCIRGPGIVYSRAAMSAMCQALPQCEADHRARDVPADVYLAHCMKEHMGITCSPRNEIFLDINDDDPLTLLETFLHETEQIISLHPVKAPWTMHTIHRDHSERIMRRLLESLDAVTHKRQAFKETHHILSPQNRQETTDTSREQTSNIITDNTYPHGANESLSGVVVFDDNFVTYKPDWCSPYKPAVPSLKAELQSVILLANTSLRLGEGLQCPHMLGGHFRRHQTGTRYEVDLACWEGTPDHVVSATVTIDSELQAMRTKKIRRRKLQDDLVLVVFSSENDTGLFLFLMKLQKVMESHQENCVVYIVLEKATSTSEQSTIYPSSEVEFWLRSSSLVSNVFVHSKPHRIRTVQLLIGEVQRTHPDATVLMTNTAFQIHSDFLTRCRILTRKNKHVYYPYPTLKMLDTNSFESGMLHYMWTTSPRPYCIHSSDLSTLVPPTESILSFTKRETEHKIKVTRTIDFGLEVD